MKSLHLTIMVFCHVLLASLVFYFAASLANASPLVAPPASSLPQVAQPIEHNSKQQAQVQAEKAHSPQITEAQKAETVLTARAAPAIEPKAAAAAAAAAMVVPIQPQQQVVAANVPAVPVSALPNGAASSPQQAPASKLIVDQVEKSAPVAKKDEQPVVLKSPETIAVAEQPRVEQQHKEVAESKLDGKKERVVSEKEAVKKGEESIEVRNVPIELVEQKKFVEPKQQEQQRELEAKKVVAIVASESKFEKLPEPSALVGATAAHSPVHSSAFVEQTKEEKAKKSFVEQRSQEMKAKSSSPDFVVKSNVKKEEQVGGDVVDAVQKAAVDPFSMSEKKEQEERQEKKSVEENLEQKSSAVVKEVKVIEEQQQHKSVEANLKGKMSGSESVEEQKQQLAVVSHNNKPAPLVYGGLGPLHLLATTLCSYQPDRQVADDSVNQLYARRAIVRKSLFDFMSLKFTNLEKLSSRLGYGLQVVPVKSVPDVLASSASGSGSGSANKPSHGWPVVGKCTAHDLKLMGEAAWCECYEGDHDCKSSNQPSAVAASPSNPTSSDASEAKQVEGKKLEQLLVATSKQQHEKSARSIDTVDSFSPEQSSVISKILHVGDIKDPAVPVVESNFYNLNLTQQQLATLEAQATSTLDCRRNALRYSKALFQHLAEDQQSRSDSWPKLYSQISSDDCARKRMIDIINALSSFRTDTTSIRRDNVEFAFAMDDLRTKVLENEVNIPLTFDRHFIEVEQFLQQSVRLMLASVQPKRAKLTSMRYRSLMYGATNGVANTDEQQQCIDLHQRLLAKNYPNDCNPTQFGQLPDVLRMTANSLELWSIEKELSLHLAKIADYPNSNPVGQQKVKEDVNECIANLVAS